MFNRTTRFWRGIIVVPRYRFSRFVCLFVLRYRRLLAFTRSIGPSVDHRVSHAAAVSFQLDVTHVEHGILFGILFYLGHNT